LRFPFAYLANKRRKVVKSWLRQLRFRPPRTKPLVTERNTIDFSAQTFKHDNGDVMGGSLHETQNASGMAGYFFVLVDGMFRMAQWRR
jgi:hypothetical protein